MNKYLTLALVVGSLVPSLSYSVPTSFDKKVEAIFKTSMATLLLIRAGNCFYDIAKQESMSTDTKWMLGAIGSIEIIAGSCCLYDAYRNYQEAKKIDSLEAEKKRIEEKIKLVQQSKRNI